jgi:diguanylate cyclase (GGDEF)-like protein
MDPTVSGPSPSPPSAPPSERRQQAAAHLRARAETIATTCLAGLVVPGVSESDLVPVGAAIARLLTQAVHQGACDSRHDEVSGLVNLVASLGIDPPQVFDAVYRAMNAAVDEAVAATASPAIGRLVTRAGFDVLSAWTTRTLELPTMPTVTDRLTTLHTRVVLDTVLLKECQRAERYEHWVSMLLIDVDHLTDINRVRGHGVGDQVLERVSIFIRTYFREQDWVARYREDVVAVLLPETGPDDALSLATLMRDMVEQRLSIDDDMARPVTVSVAVASARPLNGYPIDADRIAEELDGALERVKDGDRTRIEVVEIHPVVEPDPAGDR